MAGTQVMTVHLAAATKIDKLRTSDSSAMHCCFSTRTDKFIRLFYETISPTSSAQ